MGTSLSMMVCQALADAEGTSASACKYDVWNWDGLLSGLKALGEFAYQLTPIPDAVGCVGGDAWSCAWMAAGFIPGGRVVRAADNMADTANGARKGARACKVNSFVPGTKVLMADGTSKPIEDVKVGDEVVATDPTTGETAAKTVVGTITTEGRKDLVKLTVDTDGPVGAATGSVVATGNHPIWVPTMRRWLDASAVRAADSLRTVGGTQVDVATVRTYNRQQRVHNLTIAGIHTYYVLAGDATLLVHNCPKLSDPLPAGMNNGIASAYDAVKAGQVTSHGTYAGREHTWWAGAKEYRVPGRPETDRILEKELPNGVKVYGWTTTHYQKIQRFSAPHFPDSGWK